MHNQGELHENPWNHDLNIVVPSPCPSAYPIDSIGFDPTLFSLADKEKYKIKKKRFVLFYLNSQRHE